MNQWQAEQVASAVGETVLRNLDQEDAKLDETIRRLENAGEDELEQLRAKRMRQMKAQAEKQQSLKAQGHGEVTTLSDTKEFFEAIKKSNQLVVHFFTPQNEFCPLVDDHIQKLAPKHLETRFLRIDAEKSEFLVQKLGIWMMPCLALVKEQQVKRMVQGLDEIGGGSDRFSTAFLAYYLSAQEVLNYDGPEPEDALDDCGGMYNTNGSTGLSKEEREELRNRRIQQTIYYDSDLEEED